VEVDEEEGEEDDWMVPHGYLSDGEGIEDEDEVSQQFVLFCGLKTLG